MVDDLSNCQENRDDSDNLPPSLWRVKQITGKECLHFVRGKNMRKQISTADGCGVSATARAKGNYSPQLFNEYLLT